MNNSKYVWQKADYEYIKYVKNELSKGNSVANKIVKECSFIDSFLLVPNNTKSKYFSNLETGGVCEFEETTMILCEELYSKEYLLVFENVLKKRTDPYFKKLNIPNFNFNDEVYFYYNSLRENNFDLLLNIIKESDRYPFIGYSVKNLSSKELFNPNIDSLVANIIEVYIGAFDQESYIKSKLKC